LEALSQEAYYFQHRNSFFPHELGGRKGRKQGERKEGGREEDKREGEGGVKDGKERKRLKGKERGRKVRAG